MASLKDIVKSEYDTIADGIAWVAVYKKGGSWSSDYFYPDSGDYDEGFVFDEDDTETMLKILLTDPNAIFINGYYMGFGYELSHKDTESRVLWMYTEGYNQLSDYVA